MDIFRPMVVYLLWSCKAGNHLTVSFGLGKTLTNIICINLSILPNTEFGILNLTTSKVPFYFHSLFHEFTERKLSGHCWKSPEEMLDAINVSRI